MCALHATHSGRQILCNPARDDLNCWIIDLKAWTEIWGGRSHAILPRIPLSPLPLCRFFASQLAWTHPYAQGTPACSRGQGKTNEDLCYSSSDTEYVAGSSKTARRWIPPGHCGRALARYSSATSSCLHDFLKWLFPPYLWDPVPTWSTGWQEGSGARKSVTWRQTMKPTKDSEHLLPGHYDLGLVHNPLPQLWFCLCVLRAGFAVLTPQIAAVKSFLWVTAASDSGTRLHFQQEKHIRKPLFDIKASTVS